MDLSEFSARGGHARAKKLSAKARKDIAVRANKARWAKAKKSITKKQ